jgi:MFS family permease
MVVLDATIVNIALPTAQHDLGFSNGDRQWVITAYSLAFGGLLLLGGRIADKVGRRTTFLIGVAGFAAASAVAGAATDFTMLISARAVQGAFGAVLAPSALALLNTAFPAGKDRGRAFGIYGAIAGTGGAVGLLLGGVLTQTLSWRWTLYVNVAFAALAFAGGSAFLKQAGRARDTVVDIPGAALAVSGLFAGPAGDAGGHGAGRGERVPADVPRCPQYLHRARAARAAHHGCRLRAHLRHRHERGYRRHQRPGFRRRLGRRQHHAAGRRIRRHLAA